MTATTTRRCQAKNPVTCPRHGIPIHKQYISATINVEEYLTARENENRHKRATEGKQIPLKDLNANELANELIQASKNESWLNAEHIESSIELAAILHAHQKRGNRGNFKNTPYLEHPLRNAVRLLRLGVKDNSVIIAAILHDTLEDGAQEYITSVDGSEHPHDEPEARRKLAEHITDTYGAKTYSLVQAVTNDYLTDTDKATRTAQQKRDTYLNHVKKSIANNPGVILVKISDFIDNATGLHHNNIPGREEKTYNQAAKYLPVVDVFITELSKTKLPISKQAQQGLIQNMLLTKIRLQSIINNYQKATTV